MRKNSKSENHKEQQPREQRDYIEIEAPTVEEAIKKALKALKVQKKEVTIEVLKEEHKGLFGMEGAEPAKVRATLKTA